MTPTNSANMPRPATRFLALACHCLSAGLLWSSPLSISAQPIPDIVPPGTLFHDFDHDGIKEKLISREGTNEIQTWDSTTKQ